MGYSFPFQKLSIYFLTRELFAPVEWNQKFASKILPKLTELNVVEHFQKLKETTIHWPEEPKEKMEEEDDGVLLMPPLKKAKV